MKKQIAIFLDGTWNVVTNDTNVWRMKALCEQSDSQICYYSAGVGTQVGMKVLGGMFGFGLEQEILDAYEWLVEHYSDGDEIFIFGFSRGAYTARSLSGLISKCGLVGLGSPLGVGQLFERYRKDRSVRTIRELRRDKEKGLGPALSTEEEWMLEYCKAPPIKFIGVWDTVGSLGIPFGNFPFSKRSFRFLETDLRINNSYAFHAMAIDENRKAFLPTLWTHTTKKNSKPSDEYPERTLNQVEQRWFIGAHANVGGGYDSDVLAQLPLKWLITKAELHGLKFRSDLYVRLDKGDSTIADSYKEFFYGLYRFFSWFRYWRPLGIARQRKDGQHVTNNINETIDISVFERWQKNSDYRPKNLSAWATRLKIDVMNLQNSVKADNPSQIV